MGAERSSVGQLVVLVLLLLAVDVDGQSTGFGNCSDFVHPGREVLMGRYEGRVWFYPLVNGTLDVDDFYAQVVNVTIEVNTTNTSNATNATNVTISDNSTRIHAMYPLHNQRVLLIYERQGLPYAVIYLHSGENQTSTVDVASLPDAVELDLKEFDQSALFRNVLITRGACTQFNMTSETTFTTNTTSCSDIKDIEGFVHNPCNSKNSTLFKNELVQNFDNWWVEEHDELGWVVFEDDGDHSRKLTCSLGKLDQRVDVFGFLHNYKCENLGTLLEDHFVVVESSAGSAFLSLVTLLFAFVFTI